MSELQKPEIPEWAARVGAEVRNRTEQLPTNEPYLVESDGAATGDLRERA